MLQRLFALLLGLALVPAQAFAQGKATKIVVAFPPGGPVDIVARILAEPLTKELGHPVIIENKPGANAIIASEYAARSPRRSRNTTRASCWWTRKTRWLPTTASPSCSRKRPRLSFRRRPHRRRLFCARIPAAGVLFSDELITKVSVHNYCRYFPILLLMID